MMDADMGPKPNTGLAIGLAIATTLLCCLIGGGISAAMAFQANTAANAGDYEGARSKLKTAYILMIISAVIGLAVNGLYIASEM